MLFFFHNSATCYIYGPNNDSPDFYFKIDEIIKNNQQDYLLITGDLNMVLDPEKDSHNYVNINNPRARATILNMISEYNLIDLFRYFNPDKIRYTWRRRNPVKQARLDYILTSNILTDLIDSCDISPGYRSDHAFVKTFIILNDFKRGKGIFRLNPSISLITTHDRLTDIGFG